MPRSKHSNVSYTPLHNIGESDSFLSDFDKPEQTSSIPFHNKYINITNSDAGFRFFLISCAIALVISAFNSTFLSVKNSYQLFATSKPPYRTPSVYMGLENLKPNTSVCRSRKTFPKTFATFGGDDVRHLTRVHAPDDRLTLSFGGETSAHVGFYIPDYGLNNCTVTIKSVPDPYAIHNANSSVEIWRLSQSASLSHKVLLGTLTLSEDTAMESTTEPFYCPSRSDMFLQWRCPQESCRITLPLEGVTTMTASAKSLTQTGFRIDQYELLNCIQS